MIRKILLIALLGAFSASATHASLGDLLPNELEDSEGNEVSRDSLQGKIIGIYFSAEWCPPCRAFTPELVKFRNENKDNFEVVFVSRDATPEAQRTYMTNYKMDFLAVEHDSETTAKLREKFSITGIPTLVIVDSDGNLITRDGRAGVAQNADNALAEWRK